MIRASLVLAALLTASPSFAQTNVAGDWNFTMVSPQGTNTTKVTLKQDGEKVSGAFKGQAGELPLDGTLTGDDVKLTFTVQFQGQSLPITLTGKVAGATITGKADYGGFAEGEFTAKRAEETAAATTTAPAATTTEPATATTTTAGGMTGKWDVTLKTPGGEFPATATFTEDGGKLTGTFGSQMGEAPVTGTVEGKTFKLTLLAKTPQGDMTVELSGEVDGDSIVNGKAEIAGMGQMEWTAKRAKP